MSIPDRRIFWLLVVLLGLASGYLVGAFATGLASGTPFADFFAIWSFARIAITHPVAVLFDPAELHRLQVGLGMRPALIYPFGYPPNFLTLIWPLGLLGFLAAYTVWMVVTGGAYLASLLPGTAHRRAILATAVLAPASTTCIVAGQTGFLFAALLVGGARLARSRPVLAGILFGLLTCKPQFGILVPVALLACGAWRAILAASATALILAAVTGLGFGWSVWPNWLAGASRYAAIFFRAERHGHLASMMPTVLATSQRLGAPPDLAWALQGLAALATAVAVWTAWRRFPAALAVPVLLAGTILATPYAFTYDLPILTAAVLLFADHGLRASAGITPTEIAVVLFALAAPALMASHISAPVGAVAAALFLLLVLARGRRESAIATMAPAGTG